MTADDLVVVDEPSARRYEARLNGRVVGFTEYRPIHGRLVFFHTEVDPAFGGRSIGSRLAAAALDDVRAKGLEIRVLCPFIRAYLDRHPEYDNLRAQREAPPTA